MVLLLCDDTPGHAENLLEHIQALQRLSRHRVRKYNPVGTNRVRLLDVDQFDVVVIHYSLFIGSEGYIPKPLREAIRAFEGLKVQFIQDEYRLVDEITTLMRDLGVDVLYTLVPADAVSEVYGPRLPGVHIVPTLAGFVPHDLAMRRVPALSDRPVEIGYRGRSVPFWLGRLGQEKVSIGKGVLERAGALGIVTDIAWREQDRIYGDDWYRFLTCCKVTLGTESGSSIVDYDGALQRRVDAYRTEHPSAGFEEVHTAILAPYEGNTVINVVSPRVFEAAALRTGLVLFPGDHSGVVRPWEHYVPLEKDFSNLDEVVSAIRDPALLQPLIDTAFEELVASGDYSLRRFVGEFDALLDERGEPVGRRRGVDVRLARTEARLRKAFLSRDALSVRFARDAVKLVDVLRSRPLRRLLFGYLRRRFVRWRRFHPRSPRRPAQTRCVAKGAAGELDTSEPLGIAVSFDRADGRLTIRTFAIEKRPSGAADSDLTVACEALLHRDVASIVSDSSELRRRKACSDWRTGGCCEGASQGDGRRAGGRRVRARAIACTMRTLRDYALTAARNLHRHGAPVVHDAAPAGTNVRRRLLGRPYG